jgi:hypothetical protein
VIDHQVPGDPGQDGPQRAALAAQGGELTVDRQQTIRLKGRVRVLDERDLFDPCSA